MSPKGTHFHGRVLRSPEVFTSPHGQRPAPMKPARPCRPNVCLVEGFCFTTHHCRARRPSHDTALMDGCHPKVCGVRLGGLLFHLRQLVRVVMCQVYTLQHTVGGLRCQVYNLPIGPRVYTHVASLYGWLKRHPAVAVVGHHLTRVGWCTCVLRALTCRCVRT